jgi:2-polyprenyl-6-methoxyphenol hydroxylase-like FAD-dependent oxidoreductase
LSKLEGKVAIVTGGGPEDPDGHPAAGGDHRAAFDRYEREMRGYVKRGQEQVKGASGFLLPKSRSQVWLRNQFIRMLPYMPWKSLIAGGVQKATSAITLKDYVLS